MIEKLKNKSLRFQILVIVSAILVIPVLVIIYDLFFLSTKDEMLLKTKEERLGTIDQTLVTNISKELNREQSATLTAKQNTVKKLFIEFAKPIADVNQGVRLGLYIPATNEIYVQGFLHSYIKRSPAEERARQVRIMNEAKTGLHAVTATGETLARVTGSLGDQTFEYLIPLQDNGKMVGVIWADEIVNPILTSSRNFSLIIRFFTLFGFTIGTLGVLYIIHNLTSRVGKIKSGLTRLEADIHYQLPPLPGEMGEVVKAINRMAGALCEKEKLEEELHRSERLAALGRLVTGVAHELRNPIGIIKAAVQAVENDYKDLPDFSELAKIIKDSVDRQNRVIKELLDFGRPSRSNVELLSVNNLIEAVLTFSAPMLRQSGINLTTKLAPNLPRLEADGEKLKQVFVNLILNAVQSMSNGGNLEISSEYFMNKIQVTFTDTGTGIKEEEVPTIFDPFFTTKDYGSGLGLSISHQIIKMHGGTIQVSHTSANGTTFLISLPVAKDLEVERNGI